MVKKMVKLLQSPHEYWVFTTVFFYFHTIRKRKLKKEKIYLPFIL